MIQTLTMFFFLIKIKDMELMLEIKQPIPYLDYRQ